MHRHVPLVAVIGVLALGLVSGARALTDADLECQSAVGEAGREFAAARLKALVACNNQVVAGDTCDVARRDRVIAGATDKLVRRISAACRDVAFEDLRFPVVCYDNTGGSFVVEDLTSCIEIQHRYDTDTAVSSEYHLVQTSLGHERRCQRMLGRASSAFLAASMRVRGRCLDAQLGGLIPEAVDCRAQAQPYGPGTGDARTDRALTRVTTLFYSRLAEACFRADVAALGFPGSCPPPLGDLGVDDVQRCLRETHHGVSKRLLDIEYPPESTPEPTPSPSPLPIALRIVPESIKRLVGQVQNYSVIGDYADGASRNLTQRVVYSSSDESVAVTPNEPPNLGRVLTVGRGRALITATEPITGLVTNAATLNVLSCPHDACTVGEALDSGCTPCVTVICTADPSCCADGWSQACVDAVASTCGASCTTGATSE